MIHFEIIFLYSVKSGVQLYSSVGLLGFPCRLAGKQSVCNAGDLGSIPGLGRSPGEGKGYPLQYSGLENSMDSIDHGVAKHRTQLRDFHNVGILRFSASFIKNTILSYLYPCQNLIDHKYKGLFMDSQLTSVDLWSLSHQHSLLIVVTVQSVWNCHCEFSAVVV